jgi:hypothetical protein
MTTNTVKFKLGDADDAEGIAELLTRLYGAKLQAQTASSWSVTPVLQSWTVTDTEVSVTFYPGVIEILGRELTARELLKAAGKSVCH